MNSYCFATIISNRGNNWPKFYIWIHSDPTEKKTFWEVEQAWFLDEQLIDYSVWLCLSDKLIKETAVDCARQEILCDQALPKKIFNQGKNRQKTIILNFVFGCV